MFDEKDLAAALVSVCAIAKPFQLPGIIPQYRGGQVLLVQGLQMLQIFSIILICKTRTVLLPSCTQYYLHQKIVSDFYLIGRLESTSSRRWVRMVALQ